MIITTQLRVNFLKQTFSGGGNGYFWWQLTAAQKLQRFKHLSWLVVILIGLLFWRLEFWLAFGFSLLIVFDWRTTWQLLKLRASLARRN